MVLCRALAAPPAGSGHRPGAGAGRPHAKLCHHAGPVVPGLLPSALGPELYLAGPDVQPDGVLSVGTKQRVTGTLQHVPTLGNMLKWAQELPTATTFLEGSL